MYPDTVTIVLPCYNCVPYIEETVQRYSRSAAAVFFCRPDISRSIELTRTHLRSALTAQRLRDIHVDIVMVDDGSTDASLSLLHHIAGNPLYRNYSVMGLSPNGGAAAARNAGVASATGKVIAFAESDDWYLEHHLWSCLSPFIKDPKPRVHEDKNLHGKRHPSALADRSRRRQPSQHVRAARVISVLWGFSNHGPSKRRHGRRPYGHYHALDVPVLNFTPTPLVIEYVKATSCTNACRNSPVLPGTRP